VGHDVGERLKLAGFDIDVVFTPGHSPGHVTYAIEDAQALLAGDVLFQGSVGRTDLPGGDHPTLLRSIATLLERYPDETTVYPGHMGLTTLGRERATNPFLAELAR
jgi:glyoxylase-like metal-dependent hydrolase (beta-lactamase superfamily II)